tara:strand:- start:2471 stop:2821 length:351 start_codon:yes stop_codon:yes gene_type:complete
MSFNKRLTYYFFGLLIGCLITYFIVNQKNTEFNYLPNKRVISDFKKKKWEFDNSFINYDTINITNNSKILFSESIINKDTCNNYKLQKKLNSKLYTFKAINCNEKVYFEDLSLSPE